MSELPIEAIRAEVLAAAREGGGVVLQAPTGSGKSTRAPQMLLEALPEGEIWVLEPRRLAVRSLAARVASERGGEVGGEVGYRVRFESRVGPATRLLFLTPGTALRMLSGNPELRGVAALCFDEFHERGADSDALAALALELCTTSRPDLRVWILSATLDPVRLVAWFSARGVGARQLSSQGRAYPVELSHLPPESGEMLARTVARALRQILSSLQGDVLVFLPGRDEIRRAESACRELLSHHPLAAVTEVVQLHGELEPSEQDAAVRPSTPGRFKVILSTNVAETSLTLPGVRHVVDSGLVRRARFDPRRGLNTLWTVRADRKSAEQRAGRAGRTAAGDCLRLWDPRDLPPEDSLPEIARLELSGLWLQLLGEGATPGSLPWLDAPPTEAVAAAQALLERLGALDRDGAITALGRELSKLPVSPRTARVLWEARVNGGLAAALEWASEHESQGGGDARRLRDRLRGMFGPGKGGPVPLGRLLLPSFSDAIATATDGGRWRLPDGRTAALDQSQQASPLLLALEVQETAARERGTSLRIRQAVPLDPDWIIEAFPRDSGLRQLLEWDVRARRVVGREVFELFGQELSHRPLSDDRLDRLRAEEILSEKLADGTIRWAWGDDEDLWARRVRLAAELFPERGLVRLDEGDLDLVRSALCEGCLAAPGVEGREVLPFLREVVGAEGCAFVESMLPLRLNLPNGKRAQLEYRDDGPPLVRARISDLIGLKSSQVRIAQGRVAILWEILAPNHRPVQRTADLDGFWSGAYPEIRKDLARRYPKHPWP